MPNIVVCKTRDTPTEAFLAVLIDFQAGKILESSKPLDENMVRTLLKDSYRESDGIIEQRLALARSEFAKKPSRA